MYRTHIYITKEDQETFKNIKLEIRQLWYARKKQSLTAGGVMMKSLIFFRDYLKGIELEETNDSKRKDIYKYERIRK